MKFGANKGFTTIEVLLALSISFLCISLFYPCMKAVNYQQEDQVEEMEDMMGIEQLRIYLACGMISEVKEHSLIFQNEYTLSIVNGQLTLQPGTLVFLTDLQEVSFYLEDTYVCMNYKKGNRYYDVWIGFQ